ncbi:hypothetical protein [Rheinheimera sp. 4Y26]|uniref:hypothetical protein n=1 Tax=Rheinheimera sp. 4Y26 TaxID=2977811 RepID=UPI0021B0C629|nr:hypothetical protein [Rheinheimera sp. 4Y26]MCT6700922.1 hypothetical protein [Rheinheimera sp. 4Y26]
MTLRAEEEYMLFKLNPGAYGTDQALVAADAIAVFDVGYSQEFTKEQMKEALGFPGSPFEKITGGYQQLTFKCYVRGASDGQVDTPVPYGPLLRAAGNSETVELTGVSYAPVTQNFEHGTLWYYVGGANGVLHKMIGVRMSAKFVSKVGGLDYWEFTAMGLDVDPVAAGALPDVDWSGLTVPMHTAANTVQTMTLFGAAVGMATLTITPGNTFSHMHVTNQEEIAFEARNGSVDISIVEPDPTVVNYWLKAKKGDQGALAYQRGKTASNGGDIVAWNIPNLQLASATRRNDAGRLYLDLKLNIKPLTKNSDYVFQTK